MKAKRMLLLIGGASAIALAASLVHTADLEPMVVNSVTGTLHIDQGIPCGHTVKDTTVTQGRLEIAPAEGLDVTGGKFFVLTRANLSFAPFSMSDSCYGFSGSRTYTTVSVQLAKAVSFTALAAGGGVFDVTIPKDDFVIYESSVADGRSETAYKHPKEDVTGTINLTLGTITMHAVIATKVHFEEGCVPYVGCVINEDDDGTLTANLAGTITFPDSDGDGVADRVDNCRFVANPDQSPVPTPTISAPPSLTLASCADHSIGAAKAADVCDAGPVTVTNNAPGRFAVGANVVTWRAQDAKLRVATSPQTVTIVDTTPPMFTFIPPDITVNNCGPVPLGLPTATDDCAGAVTFTNNAPGYFLVGTTPVTWTAHDVSGNTTNATQMVTVHDTVPPTVSCVPAGPPGGTFQVSATDACDTPVIRLGSFVLANAERIKINETGQSGVTLINDIGPDHVRHFHVGKGEGVITATDASGNVASAICR